jgi:hypothetical protein
MVNASILRTSFKPILFGDWSRRLSADSKALRLRQEFGEFKESVDKRIALSKQKE